MSALSNSRHEIFAQELAKGKSAASAYVLAGFVENRHNAAALARKQHILDRMAEILDGRSKIEARATERAADRLSLDREWVLSRMMLNASLSLGEAKVKKTIISKDTGFASEVDVIERDAMAANRALELLGRELNLFIAKSEVGNPGDFDRLSDDELDERIASEKAEILALVSGKETAREQEDTIESSRRFN